MVRFSELVVEQPAIAELDINPLLASPDRLLALDARVILHPGGCGCRRPAAPGHPALPAPVRQALDRRPTAWSFVIRPIRPEDETLLVDFHGRLSERDRLPALLREARLRAAHRPRAARPRLLHRLRPRDRPGGRAARRRRPGKLRIAGVGPHGPAAGNSADAELSLVVCDECQGQGLGTELVRRLIEVGRAEGIERLRGGGAGTNGGMIRICRELGFTITAEDGGKTVQAELRLQG